MEMGTPVLLFAAFASVILSVYCQERPNIAMEPKTSHVYLKEGGEMVLICSSTSTRDDIILVWETPDGFLQDKKLGFVKEKIVIYDTKTQPKSIIGHKAELHVINHKMPGPYKCQVKADNGNEVLNEFPVHFHTVKEEVQDATFHRDNKTLTISCKITVDGTYDAPVWKRGDTLVKNLEAEFGGEFEENGENLTINNVMRSDAALYTAEYSITKDGSEPFLYDCNVPLNADPLVLDFEKSKNLIQEDDMELHCKVLGYPISKVEWHKDNVALNVTEKGRENERVKGLAYEGLEGATLKIESVTFDDGGDYKCTAYGAASSEPIANSSKTITVRVKDKFAALWPFLGIVGEVIVLCTIIFIYEKRRSRQAEQEEAAQDEPDPAPKGNVRNRRNRN